MARMEANIDANQERISAWLGEIKACREATKVCLEKAKANPEKTKSGMEEMEAAVDVFEERLNKMDTTDLKANREKSEAMAVHHERTISEHWRTDLGASDRLWDTGTHGEEGPRTILYKGPLNDRRSRRYYGRARNAKME
jgi:hypothetical protein